MEMDRGGGGLEGGKQSTVRTYSQPASQSANAKTVPCARPPATVLNPDPAAASTMSRIEACSWVEPGQKALHIKRNFDNVGGC